MDFGDDERGQSVLVGSILLFAMLIVAFSTYQAVVVPNQNSGVEFNHNLDAQHQMQDVRSSIIRAGGTGSTQSTGVQLGTTYPSRLIALNPPPSTGSFETSQANELNISIVSGEPENDQLRAYWDSQGEVQFTTQLIEYRPSYNEYRSSPDTVLEHSLRYNRFDEGRTLQSDQAIVSGRYLSFVLIDGRFERAGSNKIDVDARPVSVPTKQVTISGPVEIKIQTELPREQWEEVLQDELESGDVQIAGFTEGSPNEIELDFSGDSYDLRLAKVQLGDRTESAEPAYITRVGGTTARVGESFAFEVRDRYNNPVSGAEVTIGGETRETNSDGRVILSRSDPGIVEASIGGEDWETDEVEVLSEPAGGGDSTFGPVTKNVDADQQSVTEGESFTLSATADSIGDTTTYRSGTPIQSFRWTSNRSESGEFNLNLNPDATNRNQTNSTSIDTTGWEVGHHQITVIAQDASGRETPEDDRATETIEVLADEPAPAEPALSNLDIAGQGADATVSEGDAGDVTVDVENVGEESDAFTVELEIANGETVTESVMTSTLAPGASETVTFTDPISGLSADEYTVNVADSDGINSVSGTLSVESVDEPTFETLSAESDGPGGNSNIRSVSFSGSVSNVNEAGSIRVELEDGGETYYQDEISMGEPLEELDTGNLAQADRRATPVDIRITLLDEDGNQYEQATGTFTDNNQVLTLDDGLDR